MRKGTIGSQIKTKIIHRYTTNSVLGEISKRKEKKNNNNNREDLREIL